MKIILLLFIVLTTLFSNENYELKLYEKVLPALFKMKLLTIYTDKKHKVIMQKSKRFTLVNHCKDAVLLFGSYFNSLPQECQNKPVFYTNYRNYKKDKNGFGVFYWRKGRPQIKFKKFTLEAMHLKLPQNLQRYAE